jgi:hypothetical protein
MLFSVLRSEWVKNIFRVIGAYGIIVVFAQDIGVRTGCRQAMLTQHPIVQLMIFISVAFSVTDDFGQSFTGAFIYFVLKYFVSRGVTNDVCFPTDCEIRSCGEEN